MFLCTVATAHLLLQMSPRAAQNCLYVSININSLLLFILYTVDDPLLPFYISFYHTITLHCHFNQDIAMAASSNVTLKRQIGRQRKKDPSHGFLAYLERKGQRRTGLRRGSEYQDRSHRDHSVLHPRFIPQGMRVKCGE